MEKEQREIQSFIKRLRPSMRFFYRAAYAITADRQMAEYALGEAISKAYMKGSAPTESLGFRDNMLAVIRECALERLRSEPSEGEWEGFFPDPEKPDRLSELVARESLAVQRMSVLRYGCAMTIREIAALMQTDSGSVQDELNRSRLRIERAMSRENRPVRPFDRMAMRSIRQTMNRESGDQVDVEYILRDFEAEIAGRRRPRRVLMRLGKGLLLGLIGLLFAVLLWLLAVLMEM